MVGEKGSGVDVVALAGVAIQIVPEIIALVKRMTKVADPNTPTPTDAEVVEALNQAVASSIAKDDLWLAAHPDTPPPPPSSFPPNREIREGDLPTRQT